MYGLSLGISRIGDQLPAPVYALLSGLNSATVGIIALAAVQLSDKAITDKLTRILVFLGGAVGILYSSLWYFPILMVVGGLMTVVWDLRLGHSLLARAKKVLGVQGTGRTSRSSDERASTNLQSTQISRPSRSIFEQFTNPHQITSTSNATLPITETPLSQDHSPANSVHSNVNTIISRLLTWKTGLCIVALFLSSFIVILTLRTVVKHPPRGFSLFSNLYLAGTIIFGGGPVVIPLLREYVVAEGWVTPRDFILGLAIIQSFPGPNFNFAVYLGSLAVANTPLPNYVGAFVAFLGIFAPGMIIVSGVIGFWNELRSRPWLVSLLRGVNAVAVGLVYTAVYRLWQIGLVDERRSSGSPLGGDPWWVAITATSFAGGRWFGLSAPLAILLGGIMGVLWFVIVRP